MMSYRERNGVRWTHIPTGLSATCNSERTHHRCDVKALALLKAKLAKRHEDPAWVKGCGSLVRSYHLNPPLGIPPHVRSHPDGDAIPINGELSELLDRIMLERRRLYASP